MFHVNRLDAAAEDRQRQLLRQAATARRCPRAFDVDVVLFAAAHVIYQDPSGSFDARSERLMQ
jgi:uncharacterized protein (DUF1778 family)